MMSVMATRPVLRRGYQNCDRHEVSALYSPAQWQQHEFAAGIDMPERDVRPEVKWAGC